MIQYQACPVCSSKDCSPQMNVRDYTVSNDSFSIHTCHKCKLLFTQNIPDENEIGKYYQSDNYISHSDTKKGLVNSLYHRVRKKTLSSKRKLIERCTHKKNGRILDIGCGTGAFLNAMKNSGWQIEGLEPDANAAQIAFQNYGIQAKPSQALFSLPPNTYDVVTMWHVLEHVHQLDKYLQQIHNCMAGDGVLFIAVPNHVSFDAKFYKEYWAAYDVPRHLYHFSPDSMRVLLEKHHLIIDQIKPMWFDSFYVSMLSEKYKNQKGNLVRAFLVGLYSNLKTVMNPNHCSSLIYIVRKK